MSAVPILVVFVVFAGMMYARWVPAILAVPLMAVTMSLAAGVPVSRVGEVFTTGASSLASVYVAVIFGAMLGRVTLDCGIARALVNLAAEYGGESPMAVALVLSVVVALLFTSLNGLGAIIMVGSIVLPIMMTTGVPRTIAATMFLMAFALGFVFNIVNWKFYTQFFGVSQTQMIGYAIVLAVVDAVALIAYACIAFARDRGYATFAVREQEDEAPRIPAIALITPVLPLILYYALRMDPTPAFALSAIFGALVTRPKRAVTALVAAAIRGVEDVAPAILLFVGIGMLLVATRQPEFARALAPLVAGGWVRNPIAYVAVFGLASPLVLYRGPLNPFGVGIAIFTVLLSSHTIAPVVLVAAVMAVAAVQNVCDPTNTANVWVANFTGVPIALITRRTLPYQVGVATLATLVTALAAPQLFGVRAFAGIAAPVMAAENGLTVPARGANRIAVGNDGSRFAPAATSAVVAALDRPPWHAFVRRDDPNARTCDEKDYAAYALVSTSTFALEEGTDVDVGIRLEDCGGWIVDEWHEHEVEASPTIPQVQMLAQRAAARLRAWATADPGRARTLFTTGLDAAPGDPPTYFYALFKTVDGNLRAYVRAGGPAYDDGLRTNDVVEKIDGADWWTYGTFVSEQKAYDGEPHTFEVVRGGKTFDVDLGAPYVANDRSSDGIRND
jgi:hypothetical protein